MPDFLLPAGQIWTLYDSVSSEVGVAQVVAGGKALLIFTTADHAAAYARDAPLPGKVARPFQSLQAFAAFLLIELRGVTHVAIDPVHGRPAVLATLDDVAMAVRRRSKGFP